MRDAAHFGLRERLALQVRVVTLLVLDAHDLADALAQRQVVESGARGLEATLAPAREDPVDEARVGFVHVTEQLGEQLGVLAWEGRVAALGELVEVTRTPRTLAAPADR
jgi:hypothetical protein